MKNFMTSIGSNPRRYYGFPNEQELRKHIKIETPFLYPLIGKVKKLKKLFLSGTKGSDYLVYFKIRKN